MVGLCGTKKMFGGRRKSSQGLFLVEFLSLFHFRFWLWGFTLCVEDVKEMKNKS